jgi:hypothetical protein
MAVENKYVNSDIVAEKKANSAFNEGAASVIAVAQFEVAAADDNGSVYRLFKNVNPDLIPVRIEILADAITGGTDYDLGFYETSEGGVDGPEIDKDKLLDGIDFSSGFARGSEQNGLAGVGIDEAQERIYELAGDTQATKKIGYDIAITANTVGSGAGTIAVTAWFVQG